MRDWELVDSDRFSFDDSDRFEEDSLCSWVSEPESLCNNWRGWKKSNVPNTTPTSCMLTSVAGQSSGATFGCNIPATSTPLGGKKGSVSDFSSSSSTTTRGSTQLSLVELSARCVASYIPFEVVERYSPPVPEELQLRIAFWSFPDYEEDIRLYSCLANGSADEFTKGERLFKTDSVSDILQIGFHLSATVKPNVREAHNVAVTFDRRRVTCCTCTCNASTNWCSHVVAVCLSRIFQPNGVAFRVPVSESLTELKRDQLQKFAQYLISELPQQILPTAQRLLDELLSSQRSAINTLRGAPDPTAGASVNEQTAWYLDERTLHGNIHKILIKFCVPAPIVFSDVNYLSSAAPPASAEWSSLLRPLRGREPEGMWNLLSIVREMFRREDRNGIPLLEIITEECLNCDQILVWWFNTKVALLNGNSGHGGKHHSVNSNAHACQHAGSSLCDEIVLLWRLAALNPGLSPEERCILENQFKEWHLKIIEKISKSRNASINSKHANSFKNDIEVFPGFRISVEACSLDWVDFPIPGITFSEANRLYHCPFMCFRHSDGVSRSGETGLIHSSLAILNNPAGEHHLLHSVALISTAPMMMPTKRPRSVDLAGERERSGSEPRSSTSTAAISAQAQGCPKPGKSGRNSKKRYELANDGGLGSMIPCISASGLKIKNREAKRSFSQDPETSFEEDVITTAPSSTSSSGRSRVDLEEQPCTSSVAKARSLMFQRQPSVDGNRSSLSSEGFCENEAETEASNDREEGVEICELNIVTAKLNITGTSEDFEADDSDSSTSAPHRLHNLHLEGLPKIQPDIVPKFDSSDSQQSGDEYQLYYYDPKASPSSGSKKDENAGKKDNITIHVFANPRKIDDEREIKFSRAEGLHAHGHSKEACKLGVTIAQDLLASPPDLSFEVPHPPTGKGKRKKINPVAHQVSCLASATLGKCAFLCTVLAENPAHYYLAFQVGMFGLELARPPASTKPLEVKLANQEAELAQLLKRIPIGSRELEMIRQKALALRDGTFKTRGEALLPLVMANFIFDALIMPVNREGRCTLQAGVYHAATDEMLGFEAAVKALGLKANVSEADHPLLCEGTRRQRGDLALSVLLHYKDDSDKLSKIMDKLLDREIHQLCKFPVPETYYSNNPPTTIQTSHRNEDHDSTRRHSGTPLSNAASHPSVLHNSSPVEQPTIPAPRTPPAAVAVVHAVNNNESSQRPPSGHSAEGEIVAGAGGASMAAALAPVPPTNATGTARPMKETGRFKGKRSYPVLPNQPSEAGAHFMFELGKIVLSKAGGSSNQSLFTQPSNGQNQRGPHRALHMCAFHIGLYALGLHNAVSPNWMGRTYSSHVSWITGQAMEIGAPAIVFLIETWDVHVTPTEAATIADRASRGDVNMVRAASELALSCLPYAHALNPNELHRAILQCKEQSDGMLEKACVTVESAAKGGGVCPEVLFDVAKQWYSLYQKHLPSDVELLNEEYACHHDILLDPSLDPTNANVHHQLISTQTGLPVLNPNNPPPPTPSVSGTGTSNTMEVIRIAHQDSRQTPYPPIYGTPFLPPFMNGGFTPLPMAVYPQVIYQPTTMNHGGNGGYYSGHNGHPHPGSQAQSFASPMHQMPSHPHQHHINTIVSTGPALQYYAPAPNTVQVVTSTGNHLRQPAQFYPMNHMNIHHPHAMNGSQVSQPPTHSHVAAIMAASGIPSHAQMGGHLIISAGTPVQNGQPLMMQQPNNGQMPHGMNMNHGMSSQQQQINMGNAMGGQHCGYGSQMGHGGGPIGMNSMAMPPDCAGPMYGRDHMNHQPGSGQSALKMKYLLATYRVGMLAMESLARSRDDRPTAKFSRNPLHGEDIKWILSISRKLGAQYIQQFCICAMQSITNPFTLHEIILDAAAWISSRASNAWIHQNPRSPLAPLVQKCQQMYFQCLHQKLYHITASEYDDFVAIVCMARQAFHLTPDGVSQFKEWVQNLRRTKACKKDLWTQIQSALQSNPK